MYMFANFIKPYVIFMIQKYLSDILMLWGIVNLIQSSTDPPSGL